MQFWRKAVLILFLVSCSISAYAIDNPDAPDYAANFLERAKGYEDDIQQTPHTTQGYITAYARYEDFLNHELDSAYNQLMAKLGNEARRALSNSQRQWFRYRDQEFEFIARNWTHASFGSAAVISRGDYRTNIINNRIVQLLRYLQNF
ncbi:MAG: DUF1311 domain-containing protein [Nitrosomonas sp.]|jgi:uncharacterized protein YecT (DUF1311 family)|nr:DUF1311 domain-containing protein [Nitrosomonas sp.]